MEIIARRLLSQRCKVLLGQRRTLGRPRAATNRQRSAQGLHRPAALAEHSLRRRRQQGRNTVSPSIVLTAGQNALQAACHFECRETNCGHDAKPIRGHIVVAASGLSSQGARLSKTNCGFFDIVARRILATTDSNDSDGLPRSASSSSSALSTCERGGALARPSGGSIALRAAHENIDSSINKDVMASSTSRIENRAET